MTEAAHNRSHGHNRDTITIRREPAELFKILKFENLVSSGGEAKQLIADGSVEVNGEVECRKRRKIYSGDAIRFEGKTYIINFHQPIGENA